MANTSANKEAMEQTKSDLSGTGEKTANQIERATNDTWNKGSETASKVIGAVGPTLKEGYEKTEKAVESAVEITRNTTKKFPVEAILVGLGVGCILWLSVRNIFGRKE